MTNEPINYLPVPKTIVYSKQYWLLGKEKEITAHIAIWVPQRLGDLVSGAYEVRVGGSAKTSNVAGLMEALGIDGPLPF